MATVTGYTAARMKQIEDETVVNGDVVGDNLILTRRDGQTIDAGTVRGAPGPTGPSGDIRTNAEQSVAIWELEAKVLSQDNGLYGWHGEGFFPFNDRVESRTLSDDGLRPAIDSFRHEDRDQGMCGFDRSDPVQQLFGTTNAGLPTALVAEYSPSGRWIAFSYASTPFLWVLSVDPINGLTNYGFKGREAPVTAPTASPTQIAWSPDEKAIFVSFNAVPYIEAYTWEPNSATVTDANNAHAGLIAQGQTGKFGAKWANPGTAFAAFNPQSLSVHPDSTYLVSSLLSSPYLEVCSINTTTGAFGSKSANPASLVTSNGREAHFHPSGNQIGLGWSALPGVSMYAFNKTTGVIGVRTDAGNMPATSPAVTGFKFTPDGTKAVVKTSNQVSGQDSRVMMWPVSNGAFGTRYAWPALATAPAAISSQIMVDNQSVMWYNSGATPFLYAQNIDASGWVNEATRSPESGAAQNSLTSTTIVRFPLKSGTVSGVNSSMQYVYGDPIQSNSLTGQLVTTTKTLQNPATQVFILDDAVLESGVTRQYEVSLNGGTTWTVVASGSSVTLTAGTQLKIRLSMTRQNTSQRGYVYWFIAWAG